MPPVFTARPPWLGPDLQTLRNTLRPPRPRLERFPAERYVHIGDTDVDKHFAQAADFEFFWSHEFDVTD